VVLAASPDGEHGLLGVVLVGKARDAEVTISLGGIGGPSAGLMFALALFDKLTPDSLTGGLFVAGTGAILPNGTVTKIDGIALKMEAAREAGASVFLVPSENCEEAVPAADGGMRLVRVGALHDAVVALEGMRNGLTPPTC
jgi:PDZ domain-containing protein